MMSRPEFHELLDESWKRSSTVLCVGIDPSINMYPTSTVFGDIGILDFSKLVVDAVAGHVCAIKMNHAHFASQGAEAELELLIEYIHATNPFIPVILDAKRGDVDSTAVKYAEEAFDRYSADAVTVNPFMGWDAVEPFLRHKQKGVIVLCKTSNPGSFWLQDQPADSPMYLRIAERVQLEANPNLLLVVGATNEDALARVRQTAPDVTFLVPGVGAQGGSAESVLKLGSRRDGLGLIVNCSRSVIAQDRQSAKYFELVAGVARSMNETLSVGAA